MKLNRLYLLLPFMLLLVACPYSSVFKVGEPQEVSEAQWNGTWVSTRIENGKMIKDEMVFKKSGKQVIQVGTAFHIFRSDRAGKLKLKGYPVKIGDADWLLLFNPKKNSDKKYMYLGYEFSGPNQLMLKILSDTQVPEEIASAAALEQWLLANQKNPEIWEDTLRFERPAYQAKKP